MPHIQQTSLTSASKRVAASVTVCPILTVRRGVAEKVCNFAISLDVLFLYTPPLRKSGTFSLLTLLSLYSEFRHRLFVLSSNLFLTDLGV